MAVNESMTDDEVERVDLRAGIITAERVANDMECAALAWMIGVTFGRWAVALRIGQSKALRHHDSYSAAADAVHPRWDVGSRGGEVFLPLNAVMSRCNRVKEDVLGGLNRF